MKKVFGVLIVLAFAVAMSSCSSNVETIEAVVDSTVVVIDTTPVVIAPIATDSTVKP